MNKPSISLIITTYNWPQALEQVLKSVMHQKSPGVPVEVLIADDGSGQETVECVQKWQKNFPYPLIHVWQKDEGFQAARIRNLAVQQARHDYLIFVDGDCILSPHFLKRHIQIAEPSWFVSGNRVLLSEKFSHSVLKYNISLCHFGINDWMNSWHQGFSNKLFPNLFLPLPIIRKSFKRRWQGAKTCNLGMWRQDFLAVKGFDEGFKGWGFEDSDLIVRLINKGIFNKRGRFCVTVYHLWHEEVSRDKQCLNLTALQKTIKEKRTLSTKGVFC